MAMQIVELQQGTPEWHEHRRTHFNAADAAVMMGESTKKKRADLLDLYAFGTPIEYSAWVEEVLFPKGHKAEAIGRPIAEKLIGEPLFAAVGVNDDYPRLSASYDGLTMGENRCWENKLWSQALADMIAAQALTPDFYWQLEQQLLISGADSAIFSITNPDTEEFASLEYVSIPERRQRLVLGWAQFEKDLQTHKAQAVEVEVVGRAPEALPPLHIEVTGGVMASNLDQYRERALAVFQSVNRDLQTDQDFANARAAIKWCKEVEGKLANAKEAALAQTESIEALFRMIDGISAEGRNTRLELEKLVKARDLQIKGEIREQAQAELDAHLAALDERLGDRLMPTIHADFAGAMKNKRSYAMMRNAVHNVLTQAKIHASAAADRIQINLATLDAHAEHRGLFADRAQLVHKDPADLRDTVAARIAAHEKAEGERLEAQRAQIRAEEQAKAQREAEQKAEAERERIRQEEQETAQRRDDDPGFNEASTGDTLAQAEYHDHVACHQPDTGTRIKLGDVNSRIAPLSISADGLAQLGFPHVGQDKAAKLYRAADLPRIVQAMVDHLTGAQVRRAA